MQHRESSLSRPQAGRNGGRPATTYSQYCTPQTLRNISSAYTVLRLLVHGKENRSSQRLRIENSHCVFGQRELFSCEHASLFMRKSRNSRSLSGDEVVNHRRPGVDRSSKSTQEPNLWYLRFWICRDSGPMDDRSRDRDRKYNKHFLHMVKSGSNNSCCRAGKISNDFFHLLEHSTAGDVRLRIRSMPTSRVRPADPCNSSAITTAITGYFNRIAFSQPTSTSRLEAYFLHSSKRASSGKYRVARMYQTCFRHHIGMLLLPLP